MTETKGDLDSARKVFLSVGAALWAVFDTLLPTAHRAVATAYARALRVPSATVTVRKRHRCHGLSRDATSPEHLRLVRSTEISPDAFLKRSEERRVGKEV